MGYSGSSQIGSIFCLAEPEDLEYFTNEIRKGGDGGGTSWRFGFGSGFSLFLPTGWETSRRNRVKTFLRQLGFEMKTHAGKVCYKVSQQKVGR